MGEGFVKASNLDVMFTNNKQLFINFFDKANQVECIEIDNEISSINVAIYLRRIKKYDQSMLLLKAIREVYNDSYLALHECAISSAHLLDFESASEYALKALSIQPESFEAFLIMIRALALNGEYDKAKGEFDKLGVIKTENHHSAHEAVQFIEYCREFELKTTLDRVRQIQLSSNFLKAKDVAENILNSIKDKRSYSLVRLGDGEGAWISLGNYDDLKFSSLYEANRRSFLNDWFGTERLMHNRDFIDFSHKLQKDLIGHDIIGIPPAARFEQEASFLSTRGIPSSVNSLRLLNLLNSNSHSLLCTNSINLTLSEIGFYEDLISCVDKVGLITSQKDIPAMFTSRNVSISDLHFVPGDSRNFYRTSNLDEPECQFPHHLLKINSELEGRDCTGKVFLVAAGYVGKKYIKTIRDRGGIAIDIGSMADYWASIGFIK